MKRNPTTIAAVTLAALCSLVPANSGSVFGQESKTRPRTATPPAAAASTDRLEPDDASTARPGISDEVLANRREAVDEEEASVVPYYNNFMSSYRLGPEDVISVLVFDQPRYSKVGITVPPDGLISYPLIKQGIHVAGKTTRQIEDEITRQLDEYIIDPKVTVSLDKAQSARYGVVGDVGQPGIRMMTRRLSVYEAIVESGGVLPTGDKKKVTVLRRRPDGTMLTTRIDIAAIEKGKAPDNYFLTAGDQIFVPGNKFKTFQKVMSLVQVVSFARIFTGGGW